jgi:hypothetical protein
MIRIFRNIERVKEEEERAGNFWTFVIGEFFLVFLGILIALQVDNWNQNRKERKMERVLLSEMLSDLNGDLEDIEANTSTMERYKNANQVVLDFLDSNLPWHDSLGYYFAQLFGGTLFDINTSAYESLNSIGIDLIQNDKLRQQITALYSVRYNHVAANQEILFTIIIDHLLPALTENLQTISMRQKAVPVNLDELRQNNSFQEELKLARFTYGLSIGTFNEAHKQAIRLIAEIEKELEK